MAFTSLLVYACSKSSEDVNTDPPPGGGNNTCDTANSEYMADVVPILSSYCYSCHGTNSNSGSMGIILEGHANLKAKADAGILLGVITHASGYTPMPQDGTKLSDCNINKIRSWINHGAQNN